MTTRFVATIAAAIFAVLIATPGFTCTTLCLLEKGRALVAYNYDAWASEGLVLVNKRGTSKKTRVKQGASWTARYGSVTFNQFGRDDKRPHVAAWYERVQAQHGYKEGIDDRIDASYYLS